MRDNRSEGTTPYSCRKPDFEKINWQPGEFSLFIQPYINTIDLYHSLDFDPLSTQLALLDICEKYENGYELAIKALEVKGSKAGLFVNIKISGSDHDIQNSEISEYYYGRIGYYRGLGGREKQNLLAEKKKLGYRSKVNEQIEGAATIINFNIDQVINQIHNGPGDNVGRDKYSNNS